MINLSKYPITYVKLTTINGTDQRFQFRQTPDVEGMKASLKKDGQKLPVILIERAGGERVILCGWTRYLAETELGWDEILAIIIPEGDFAGDDEKFRMAYVENARRKPLNNLDMIFTCKKLNEAGKSNVEIGETIDKSEGQVRRYLKVAAASKSQQKAFVEGETSIRAISGESSVSGNEGSFHGQDGDIVSRDEANLINCNIVVKSVKNGFNASLKYRVKRDGPEIVKSFFTQINAAYKTARKLESENGKSDTQKTAETERMTKKLKVAQITEGIKSMETAANEVDKAGFNALGIKMQIAAKKTELKELKSAQKSKSANAPATSLPASDSSLAGSPAGEGGEGADKQIKTEAPKQIRYTTDEGGPTALAGFMVTPIEATIALMNRQMAVPDISDEEKEKLKTGIQKLQEKIDELKRKEPKTDNKINPDDKIPDKEEANAGGQNLIGAEPDKKKEPHRKMIMGFKEMLKTTDGRERLTQVAKAQNFKTPEEYIAYMEENLKKQGLL